MNTAQVTDSLQRRRRQITAWLAEEIAGRNHPRVVRRYHARIRRIDSALEALERRRRRIRGNPPQAHIVGQHISALALFQMRLRAHTEGDSTAATARW